MTRLNVVLFATLILFALGVVASQHQARKRFVELQAEQDHMRELEVEFGQLQLEQSTWATHARIERVATKQLGMRVPPAARVHVVPPPPAPTNQ